MAINVETLLNDKGVNYQLIPSASRSINFIDVIKHTASINPNEVCKTIIVRSDSGVNYAFMIKGSDKIDLLKAGEIVNSKLRVLSISELMDLTGFSPGEVTPLLLNIPIFIDEEVLKCSKINFGSGDSRYGVEVSPLDLSRLFNYKAVRVAQ